jgi:hypothetical protein
VGFHRSLIVKMVLALVPLLAAAGAHAQQANTAVVVGTVDDATAAPLPVARRGRRAENEAKST